MASNNEYEQQSYWNSKDNKKWINDFLLHPIKNVISVTGYSRNSEIRLDRLDGGVDGRKSISVKTDNSTEIQWYESSNGEKTFKYKK